MVTPSNGGPRSNAWKTRAMIADGMVDALAGVLAAMLFIRSSEATGTTQPRVQPKAALTVSMNVLDALRQIAGLAEK